MAGEFTLDYLVFVCFATMGVLQMVAAYSSFRGLLFVQARPLAFLAGLVTTGLAFFWFFISEPRNISEIDGGLDGNQMAGLFSLAAGTAIVLTFLLSSVRNWSMGTRGHQGDPGLDALKETTYVRALLRTFKARWKR